MLIFRKARAEDIDKVVEIYSDIHTCEENGQAVIGWVRDVYPTAVTAESSLERGDLFVAEDFCGVIGAAIINNRQVDVYKEGQWKYSVPDERVMVLHTLVISPKASGKGYGEKFVKFYEQYARSKGCLYLRMDTNKKNIRARKMYKKLGYEEIGTVPCVFNGIEGVSMVLLEKRLAK